MSAVGGASGPAGGQAGGVLFHFSQVELPWELGPPEGRYLMRRPGDPADAAPAHVLVIATLGAPERRRTTRSKAQA